MMAKEKKVKEKAKRNETSNPKIKNFLKVLFSFSGIILLAVVVYFLTGSNDQPPMAKSEAESWQLVETRPVLAASRFTGKIANAYKAAAEIPEIIDQQFCYCYCKKNFDHKTLLTCFTDEHGKMCGICQNEVLQSYELYKKGVPINKIKKSIDKKFG